MGKRQACDDWVVLGWCAVLCLVLLKGVEAHENATEPLWSIVGFLPRFCKAGGDGGWNISQGNSASLQNWADRSHASQCGAFVFTSTPGANHTVTVIATTTDDRNLTAASVCQDPSVKSAGGRRNHFSTNVSLIILKFNLVYWFVSGVEGNCEPGLAFRVKGPTAPRGIEESTSSIDQSRSARDVGVIYNIEPDPEAPRGFGSYAPAQPVFLSRRSQRTVFYGDAIAGCFTPSENPVMEYFNRGPLLSCDDYTGYSSRVIRVYYRLMEPDQNFDHMIVLAGLNPHTAPPVSYCDQGTYFADVAVAQTTTDECSLNLGAPYLCPPNDGRLNIKGTNMMVILLLLCWW